MRIAFFGLPLAAVLLERDGHEFGLCALSPAVAPGRRRVRARLGPEVVVDAALLDRSALEERVDRRFAEAPPDLVVSWFWPRRLPARWIRLARFGGVGVHPSLLPRHRGPDPFYAVIDAGERFTGVSAHALTENYDEGDVFEREILEVGERNSWELARALDRPSLRVLRRVVRRFASGEPPQGAPQDERDATWAPAPEGDAARVDFSWPTERVLRRIRALAPVPGLALSVRGVDLLVTRAEACSAFPRVLLPGEAAVFGTPPRLLLVTGDGAVAVTEAELAGDDPRRLGAGEIAALVGSRPADPA